DGLCQACRRHLLSLAAPRCPFCGERKLAEELVSCASCGSQPGEFERVWTLGDYAQELRTIVLRMKQPREAPLSTAMCELLFASVGDSLAEWRPDAVLPVPMHWLRRALRGSNSAEWLGEVLARRLGVPNAAACVVRRRYTQPQSGLSPQARFRNVRRAFRLRKGVDWSQARVLVVDDILTTGATCGEIARLLRAAGAAAVAAVVVARASGSEPPHR
ncbi:MAG TPA: phosphoribosyltransferase family protein, partial [Pirellulales bacterium]|nr:phosphoribosyltransferase family protein [Pirellulales bacterium]